MSTDDNTFRRVDWTGDGWQPSDDDDENGLPVHPPRGSGLADADQELLTLAARAIGAVQVDVVEGEDWLNLHFADGSTLWNWNPLMYKDNAFDMLVKLGMTVRSDREMQRSVASWGEGERCTEHWSTTVTDDDATCRAVTRAAAEIGKQCS